MIYDWSRNYFFAFPLNYNRSLVDDGSDYSETSYEFTEDKKNSDKDQEGFLKFFNDLKTKNILNFFKYIT